MQIEQIETLIKQALPDAQVRVDDLVGDGNHFQAIVVSDQFTGMTMIKQHKLVYGALQSYLDDGTLHALSLKTYTPDQWRNTLVQVEG